MHENLCEVTVKQRNSVDFYCTYNDRILYLRLVLIEFQEM